MMTGWKLMCPSCSVNGFVSFAGSAVGDKSILPNTLEYVRCISLTLSVAIARYAYEISWLSREHSGFACLN
jgi:hypothetical protein